MAKFTKAADVTLSDSEDQSIDTRFGTPLDSIYIGTGGDVKLTLSGDSTGVVFKNMTAGTLYELSASVIWDTGTTASDIIALDTGMSYA